MNWNREFISQTYGRPTYKHNSLPLYVTDEFDFYRCVAFCSDFYGKTASELFNGNLRDCNGRYSALFKGQKLSYWADSPATARAEIKKHGAGCDVLTFWAYDDASSTFPTLSNQEPLLIVDGRKHGIQELIDRIDSGNDASEAERSMLVEIMRYEPDCIVYDSHARKGGENFLFFEKGFRKLALRELSLRFGKSHGGNHTCITCAGTCDYSPLLESYGEFFAPKARVLMDETYLKSEEYETRKRLYDESLRKIRSKHDEQT